MVHVNRTQIALGGLVVLERKSASAQRFLSVNACS